MTEKKFDELWVQIDNIAQDITNTINDASAITFNPGKKEYIKYEYDKFRQLCKDKHMIGATEDNHAARIDRHKVAACIAGAIMSTRPFEYKALNQNGLNIRLLYLANEALAFFSSLAIIKSFIRADIENVLGFNGQLKNRFLEKGFIFPEPEHDDYLPWVLYLLQDSAKIGFNVLSFSNILYLLEEFTFVKLELERSRP